jgi:hypothetical protein
MGKAPDALLRLVDRFDSTRKACPERAASDAVRSRRVFQSPDHKEEQLSKAKPRHEQESIQRHIAATDRQIDALVCELYGLKEEEIQIVEKTG